VHTDDRGLGGNGSETGTDRVASRCPAGHATLGVGGFRRGDHDDTAAGRPGYIGSVIDDPLGPDELELLGATEARPLAAGDHDGPDVLCGE
ncbi:MAG: hypothetical protein QOC57_1242, partial [Ilumatobacteraceae bacterium]